MGQAIKKYAWNRNDIVISTKLNWGEYTLQPLESTTLIVITRSQVVQMARFWSTTTAYHENTSSKVSVRH
jgi:hypothetical protein